MMVGVPGKFLATRLGNKVCQQTLTINEQALGRIVASFKRELVFISDDAKSGCALVHCAFRRSFQIGSFAFSLAAIRCTLKRSSAPKPIFPASVAGEGVLGPCGPRTGNSSGVRPGSSSGRGGSPGSCIGGGTSGRGLPGGLSCGGSDGCPGLIGGSSGGSIGISRFPEFRSGDPEPTALLRQGSDLQMPQARTSIVLLRVLPVSA